MQDRERSSDAAQRRSIPVPPFSVIIPAHNEEAVIARCLTTMLRDAPTDGLPELIVAANGCTDATVAAARAAAPHAIVLDLEQGSKFLALNGGNAVATVFPRFFVDADVVVGYAALAAAAAALRSGEALAAAPTIRIDTKGTSRAVRAYYRVWQTQPYIRDNMIGSGIYGLSEEGMRRVGSFPPIIADDGYVRTRFASGERRSIAVDATGAPATFTVTPPRTLLSLIRIESRRRAGDRQLREGYPPTVAHSGTSGGTLAATAREGVSPIDLALYLGIKTAGRGLALWNRLRGQGTTWHRDATSR